MGMRRRRGPFLKWAGGKEQLLDRFEDLWPERIERYVEPFLGSGAAFFRLGPRIETASLNDVNGQLVELFVHVRDRLLALVDALRELDGPGANTAETFYERRARYNALERHGSSVERSALFIYLNRTCFNGLYRVNSRGLFNVPFGRHANPTILDEPRLRHASMLLSKAASIDSMDFERFLKETCIEGDLVYLDPPYVPVSSTSSFTSYARGSFSETDQRRLASVLVDLHERGVRWMLSNSHTELTTTIFVKELMGRIGLPTIPPHVIELPARRAINSRTDRRGPVMEYVIRNFASRQEE